MRGGQQQPLLNVTHQHGNFSTSMPLCGAESGLLVSVTIPSCTVVLFALANRAGSHLPRILDGALQRSLTCHGSMFVQ